MRPYAYDRYKGLQSLLQICGDEGCHFLTLCSIIDEWRETHQLPYIDLIDVIRYSIKQGWVANDFYVINDLELLSKYTCGHKWTRREVTELPFINDNDYTEAVYYNKRTNFKHYRRRAFDTLDDSVTVKEGAIKEYRIYTDKGAV